ncbi:flavin reductase family protein [Nesterenkonia sandarakina]|uniref:Flavin reductase (DIM6/NTAB) family NADH-FMN oxidoreductase RutF n=1 Tax=Nesterenkonia sandarakina TaxID=272918 RepID=A0A7Z0E826_9MICC|nr:flavin reductase family protein [Nesterenkonia sandarakina]NYJ16644.1 flavin reductase (DIM6/NTAB) family NADH-FMN oxidoreductase RutF [Nesterenkonia sandarakina]
MSVPARTLENPTAASRVDSFALRHALAQFPQGIVAVGAEVDGAPEAIIASTFTVGVSLDPPLVTLAVQHNSSTWPKLERSGGELGISVLGRDQNGLCRQIASKDRANRFTGVDYQLQGSALLLDGVPMWLRTRIYDQVRAGDHDIIVLEILDLGFTEGAAGLVFHQHEFKTLTSLS